MLSDKQIIGVLTSNNTFIHKFADKCFEAQPAIIDEKTGKVIFEEEEAHWDCSDDEAYDYFMEMNGIKHFTTNLFDPDSYEFHRARYLLIEEEEALYELMLVINAYKKTQC